MNNATLVPQAHTLTVEEASKGGKASVKARREKKRLRECIEIALQAPYTTLEGEKMTRAEGIAVTMCQRALDGDVAAAKFIRDTCEGLPTIRAEVETAIPPETYERVRRALEGDV